MVMSETLHETYRANITASAVADHMYLPSVISMGAIARVLTPVMIM